MEVRGPLHNDECSQCSKKVSSFKEYQNHVNDHHYGIWKYKCGFCEFIFDKEKECLKHTRAIHRIKQIKNPKLEKEKKPKKISGICYECGSTANNISNHMNYYHGSKDPIPCQQCEQLFYSNSRLNKHIKKVHLRTQCPSCGDMVKGEMDKHMQKHISIYERPHKCETCGKSWFDKCKLVEHYNVHTGEKPFKCKYCPAAFGSNGTKAMHEKGHLGIKRKPKQKII